MSAKSRAEHWGQVYTTKDDTAVSWFQDEPHLSLALIKATGLGPGAAVIDIGGGASRLVDRLLATGYSDVTVLDIAASALTKVATRLGEAAARASMIAADITTWTPPRRYAIWHDRAVFHFLTETADRAAYHAALLSGTQTGSAVIIATFAPDGPEKCSGLPVCRYGADALAAEFSDHFDLVEAATEPHRTPGGTIQSFQYVRLQRR